MMGRDRVLIRERLWGILGWAVMGQEETPTNGEWTSQKESKAQNRLPFYPLRRLLTHSLDPLPNSETTFFLFIYITVYTRPLYPPPRYSPSTATFACQVPSLRTNLNIAGTGTTSGSETGTMTMTSNESSIVIPGLITRK
jgi:hypothetical protein